MITIRDWIASVPPEEKSVAYVGEGEAVSRQFLLTGDDWETYRDWGFFLDMAFDLSTVTQRESWVRETTQKTQSENFTESESSESTDTSSGTRKTTSSEEREVNTSGNLTRQDTTERESETTTDVDSTTTSTRTTNAKGTANVDANGKETTEDNSTVTGGDSEATQQSDEVKETILASIVDVSGSEETAATDGESNVTESATKNGSTETASTSSGSEDSTITKETRTVTEVVVDCDYTTDIAPLSKQVTEEGLVLTWVILRQHTQLPGRLRAVVRAVGANGQVKKTAVMLLEVEPSVLATPAAEVLFNEFDQMEARVSQLVDQAAAQADRAEFAADTADDVKQSCYDLQQQTASSALAASSAVYQANQQYVAAQTKAEEAAASSEAATTAWAGAANARAAAETARDEAVSARDEAAEAKAASEEAQYSAGSAAVAAINAQTYAINAQTAAETAQTAAENAAAEANAALQEAQQTTVALKGQVANALTADMRAAAVRIDDLSPLEHPYTVSVEAVNRIPYPYVDTTKTVNGVTFTDNGDGTVTVSGGREDTTVPTTFTFATGLHFPAGTYVLSGNGGMGLQLYFESEPNAETGESVHSYKLMTKLAEKEVTFAEDVYLNVYGKVTGAFSANQNTFSPKAVIASVSAIKVNKYGKNLLPYPFYTKTTTQNGVTFTDNGDGSITLNGTATARTTFYLASSKTNVFLPKGVNIALSGIPDGVGKETVFCVLRTGDSKQSIRDYGQGATMVTEYTEYLCFLIVNVGVTVDNVVVRPQIEVGGITAWEPYAEPTAYTVSAEGMVEGLELLPKEDTTLVADPPATALVHAAYNRDTNKVIEELVNAIISLGGNV
ncbi:MAG: hypothetical protein IJO76_05200 [Clostridia bacterium]|nr:hypothetical protein [Clostridia bacterium]